MEILAAIIGIIIGLGLYALINKWDYKEIYLNTSFDKTENCLGTNIDKPIFIIDKIERALTKNTCNPIYKYTCHCGILKNKDSVEILYFVFYDKELKYNVGEKLMLKLTI